MEKIWYGGDEAKSLQSNSYHTQHAMIPYWWSRLRRKVYDPKTENIRSFCGHNTIFRLKIHDLLKYTILSFGNYTIISPKVDDHYLKVYDHSTVSQGFGIKNLFFHSQIKDRIFSNKGSYIFDHLLSVKRKLEWIVWYVNKTVVLMFSVFSVDNITTYNIIIRIWIKKTN